MFALFYFVFEGKFQVQAPPGGLYSEGRFNGGFLRYDFGGLIFGEAYTWRGLFSEFYGGAIPKNRTNDRIGPISSFLKRIDFIFLSC